MKIQRRSLGSVPLVEVSGDIDHLTSDPFEAEVTGALGEGGRALVDLTGCRYIDSGGLAVLLHASRNVAPDGWLGLVGPTPDVTRLFEIVGLTTLPEIRLFSSLEEARGAIDAPGA